MGIQMSEKFILEMKIRENKRRSFKKVEISLVVLAIPMEILAAATLAITNGIGGIKQAY